MDRFKAPHERSTCHTSWLQESESRTLSSYPVVIHRRWFIQHNPAPFKLPELSRWTVVLSDPKHVLELAKASDDEFSLLEAVDDVRIDHSFENEALISCCPQYIQIRYTISHDIIDDHVYHEDLARSRLARNMDALYPHIRDEIVASFDDVLNLCGNGEEPDTMHPC